MDGLLVQSHIISVDVRILNRTDTILVIQRMPDDVAGIYISQPSAFTNLNSFWLLALLPFFLQCTPDCVALGLVECC